MKMKNKCMVRNDRFGGEWVGGWVGPSGMRRDKNVVTPRARKKEKICTPTVRSRRTGRNQDN